MAKSNQTRPATSHIAPFGVRMQPELKEQLEAKAQQSGRSLNAEVVARLENSLRQPDPDVLVSAFARLDQKIALLEVEKFTSLTSARIFAVSLRAVAERLLTTLPKDHPFVPTLAQWQKDAATFIHGLTSDPHEEAKEKMGELLRASEAISKIAGVDMNFDDAWKQLDEIKGRSK